MSGFRVMMQPSAAAARFLWPQMGWVKLRNIAATLITVLGARLYIRYLFLRRKGRRLPPGSTFEMVCPGGNSISTGKELDLLSVECMYAGMALKIGGYPILLYKLPKADANALKRSLEAALLRHPWLAGRLNIKNSERNFSGQCQLSNAGVPFTVIISGEAGAPTQIQETDMLHFGDIQDPKRVMAGVAPVLTVKLTCFKDGSGILGICRSHAIADGTYTWSFIGDWAAIARGETLPQTPVPDGRGVLRDATMTDMEEIQTHLEFKLGTRVTRKPFGISFKLLMGLQRIMDMLFFAGLAPELARTRLTFTNAELDCIKKCATPAPGSSGDGWVSTQEAIAAHVLLSLGRAILQRPSTNAVTGMDIWLDLRKQLGLPGNAALGFGFGIHRCMVDGLLEKSLSEVASDIHEGMKTFTPANSKKEFGAFAGIFSKGMGADATLEMVKRGFDHPQKGKFDLLLQLNNQSKRVMPDFGDAGGVASAVLTNAGPSLLLPTSGGAELFLCGDAFMGASAAKKAAAIKLIKEIPSA